MVNGLSASTNISHTSISYVMKKLSSKSYIRAHNYREIIFYLNKTYEALVSHLDYVDKEDLDLVNHLSGKTQKFLKLSFKNIQDLMTVRNEL